MVKEVLSPELELEQSKNITMNSQGYVIITLNTPNISSECVLAMQENVFLKNLGRWEAENPAILKSALQNEFETVDFNVPEDDYNTNDPDFALSLRSVFYPGAFRSYIRETVFIKHVLVENHHFSDDVSTLSLASQYARNLSNQYIKESVHCAINGKDCSRLVSFKDCEIDHNPALAIRFRDGEYKITQKARADSYNDISRLRVACRHCNRSDGTRDINIFQNTVKAKAHRIRY